MFYSDVQIGIMRSKIFINGYVNIPTVIVSFLNSKLSSVAIICRKTKLKKKIKH